MSCQNFVRVSDKILTPITEDQENKRNLVRFCRKNKIHRVLKKKKTRKISETKLQSNQYQTHKREYKQVIRQILKQAKRLFIKEQTYYLAISYYESFLSIDVQSYLPKNVQITTSSPKMLATVMLLISTKLHQQYPLSINQLCHYLSHVQKQNLITTEQEVFLKMDLQYIQQSPFVLFHTYFYNEIKNIKRCCQIFQRYVLQDSSIAYGSQMIAKAIIYSIKTIPLKEQNVTNKIQIKDLSSRIKKFFCY